MLTRLPFTHKLLEKEIFQARGNFPTIRMQWENWVYERRDWKHFMIMPVIDDAQNDNDVDYYILIIN